MTFLTPCSENLITNLSLLLSHLNSLSSTLQNPRFSQDLKSTAVYPQSNFPVRSQETILTALLRRKLLPADEEWEQQARETTENLHIDPEQEDDFVEWCHTRFLEITEAREFTKGTKTKEEKAVNDENEEELSEESEEEGETEEKKEQGIGLGAALKYLAQGWEPTKPPQNNNPPAGRLR